MRLGRGRGAVWPPRKRKKRERGPQAQNCWGGSAHVKHPDPSAAFIVFLAPPPHTTLLHLPASDIFSSLSTLLLSLSPSNAKLATKFPNSTARRTQDSTHWSLTSPYICFLFLKRLNIVVFWFQPMVPRRHLLQIYNICCAQFAYCKNVFGILWKTYLWISKGKNLQA